MFTLNASAGDVKWDLEQGYMALHPLSEDRLLGPLPSGRGEAKYGAWPVARLVLLPKKGDLSLCKKWRGICLLYAASKIFSSVLVARVGVMIEMFGFCAQVGFRWGRVRLWVVHHLRWALQAERVRPRNVGVFFSTSAELLKRFRERRFSLCCGGSASSATSLRL
jgi:hypothetical protein